MSRYGAFLIGEPSWSMGCGHFDSYGDPDHDCSTWGDDESSYNDWMEHAIAMHSNLRHDDFYDMIGEDLHHLHEIYYSTCADALEFYIAEGERQGWDRVWCVFETRQHGLFPIEIRGEWDEIQKYAEMATTHIVFFGPPDLFETNGFDVDYLIKTYKENHEGS